MVARNRHIVTLLPGARLDVVLVGVIVGLSIGGMASVLVPGLDARVVAPSLALVLDTVAAMVTLAVSALGWVRYRERGEPVALFQSAAFMVLTIANASAVVLATTILDARVGSTLAAPGQASLYVSTLSHLLAAALLVVGSIEALRDRHPRPGVPLLAGSILTAFAVLALQVAPSGALPALGYGLPSILVDQAAAEAAVPSLTLLGAAASVLVASLFLWAAALSRRLYRRYRSIGNAYLAVGLTVAGFAQAAATMHPALRPGVVTGGDVLWLAFGVILLLGIQAQMHATLADLEAASADQTRLRAVEVERAALTERLRLSRELHDGLAQNLWLAKLKVGHLATSPGMGPEAAALTDELSTAIDAGLMEAHQAVAAMRLSGEASGSLQDLLSRSVDEFSDRFGVLAEFECEAELPQLPARVQAEVLRIAQEALSNVRRHADATVVRVRASVEAGRLVVAVHDNGRGFDPASVGQAAFGLAGMRERATLIGGELAIQAAPGDGTRITLVGPRVLETATITVGAR